MLSLWRKFQNDRLNRPAHWRGIDLPSGHHRRLGLKGRVLIVPESVAQTMPLPEEGAVLIRICDRFRVGSLPATTAPWHEVLETGFPDLTTKGHPEDVMATPAYAQIVQEAPRVRDFIERHLDRFIVVHCQAGHSRSAAVGALVCHLRGRDDLVRLIERSGGQWRPSQWVLNALGVVA